MSDFLARMALRSQGAAPVLRPRPLSLFEGIPELFEEIHLEREAVPARRPAAPARSADPPHRAAGPPPSARTVEAWRDVSPDDRPDTAPSPMWPPATADPIERIDSPVARTPVGPALRAAGVPPSSGEAAAAAAPLPAAIVRRRSVELPAAAAAEAIRSAPFADRPAAAARNPDPESTPFAPTAFAEPSRREEARRFDPRGEWSPPASLPSPDAATAPAAAEAVPAPALGPTPPGMHHPAARAPDSRAGPLAEALAPPAVPGALGGQPFVPRVEAAPAPAPVEIRIGRIDIHAAPPAVPAAPAEAPGPSLDAFLARPRR